MRATRLLRSITLSLVAPLALTPLVLAPFILAGSAAAAVPTGGASPDTAGTSASVSPKSLAAGTTIAFAVAGLPAGEIAYVKIDDGNFCADAGVHGACVVHQQRISASGQLRGSLVIPGDLPAGRHWLRFLASKEMQDADGGYVGVKGFSVRGSSDFTVVASSRGGAAAPAAAPSAAPTLPPDTQVDATQPADSQPADAPPADAESVETAAAAGVAPAGKVIGVKPGAGAGTSTPQASTTTGAPQASASEAPQLPYVVVRRDAATQRLPLVGLIGFALLCVLAGGLVLRSRRG